MKKPRYCVEFFPNVVPNDRGGPRANRDDDTSWGSRCFTRRRDAVKFAKLAIKPLHSRDRKRTARIVSL